MKFLDIQKRIWKKRINTFVSAMKNMPSAIKQSCINMGTNTKQVVINFPRSCYDAAVDFNHYVVKTPSRIKGKCLEITKWRWKDYKRILLNNAILLSLMTLIIVLIIMNTQFLSWRNFLNILHQSSTKLIIALGVGAIIVARGTDLSAGRAVGLTALISSTFSQKLLAIGTYKPDWIGHSPFVVVLISILIGMGVGLLNGFIIAKFSVDPFIATLGMMLFLYGLNIFTADKISGSQPIGSLDPKYTSIVTDGIKLGSYVLPYLVLISFGVAIFMWILWNKTPFGKKLYAVGGNPRAAAVSGISVFWMLIITYMIGGMMYGLGGVLEGWRTGSVTSNTGNMYELDAIAACIVGGLSFTGGRGKVSGIVTGVLIFQTITYGFAFIGVSAALTYMTKGIIIVTAVALDMIKHKVKR